jgi:hypothetical protein
VNINKLAKETIVRKVIMLPGATIRNVLGTMLPFAKVFVHLKKRGRRAELSCKKRCGLPLLRLVLLGNEYRKITVPKRRVVD